MHRLALIAASTLVAACSPNDDTTPGDTTTPGLTTTGSTPEPTSSTTDAPTGSTTIDVGATASATSDATTDATTDDATTDDATTGDPAAAVHVLYSLRHPTLPAPTTGDLRHVVLTDGVASAPTTLLAPPAGGYLNDIGNLEPSDDDRFLSPLGRWAEIHGQDATERRMVWLMDVADGAPAAPTPFPPAPGGPIVDLAFAPAEDRVAYSTQPLEGPRDLVVCTFAAGGCVDAPVQINPPQPPTGSAGTATFAPVGTKLVFASGDSQVPEVRVMLGDSAVPGTASLLGSWPEAFTDFTAAFAPDAATVYLHVDATVNNQYEYFAVDIAGDVPGPLVQVSPPLSGDAFGRLAPDHHAFVWFTGDFITGDLDLYELDGTTVTGPFALTGDGPAIVKKRPPWSPDSRYFAFVSEHAQPDTGAVYLVDTGAPKPPQPVLLSAPLEPDSEVRSVYFTPDAKHLLYFTREPAAGDNLYRVAVDAPGEAVRLNDPVPADAAMTDTPRLSRDGTRLLYAVDTAAPEVRDLFHVDLSGQAPAAPVQINGEDHAFIDHGFSPDGQHAFYTREVGPEQEELYHVDLRGPTPAAPVRLSDAGEAVFSVFVVPPAP